MRAGDLVRWHGRHYRVEELENVDAEHADIGYLTGYAICRRTDDPPRGQCNPKRLRVDELAPENADTTAITVGQSVSKETKN